MKKIRGLFITTIAMTFACLVFFFVTVITSIYGYKYSYTAKVVLTELLHDTQKYAYTSAKRMVLGETTDVVYSDSRVKSLEQFFAKHDSPLLPYAQKMVEIADKNGLHYGLLPAIAMVESNLCKKIIPDSHNCWGWGIYGTTVTRFASYEEAVDTVARGLKKNYVDKGLDTPEKIMARYNPTNHNNWLGGVNFFLNILE